MKGQLALEYKTGETKIDGAGRKYLEHDKESLHVEGVVAQGSFLVIRLKGQEIFMPADRLHRANFFPAEPEPLQVLGLTVR